MKLILRIFLPMLLLFVFALLLLALPLPEPFPERFSNERNLLTSLVTGFIGIVFIIYLLRYISSSLKQQGSVLDPICSKWGLNSESLPGYGKHYTGNFDGRKVEVFYTPARRIALPLMNVYFPLQSQIRMAISEKKPLMDCKDCPQIETGYSELSNLQVYSKDTEWVQTFFEKVENRLMVNRLIAGWKKKGLRELYLQPGKLWLYAHPYYDVTFKDVEEWFDILPVLAHAVEKQAV